MRQAAPLVSIAIPAYNHAAYLAQAIESVLAQDYPRIELIVLDDGSTDNTREVLATYSGRFFWETQPNMGQARTLNRAWGMSRGEILGYLSADDVLLPRAVSTAVECLRANPDVVLTYCDFNLIDPKSRIVRRVTAPEFSYRDIIVKLACPPGPGAFFRRSAFEKTGLWDSSLKQMPDYDYWLRLGLHGKFTRIPSVLASFRVHDASQTFGRVDETRAAEPIQILTRFFDDYSLSPERVILKSRALSNAYLVSAQLHFRSDRYLIGIGCLRQAFRLYPTNLLTASTVRVILNVLFNRVGHKILWKAKDLTH